jgi:acyl carrier protein
MTTQVSPTAVEDRLFDAIAALGPDRADVRREATLEELDIDSLDLVELAQIAEEEWGVELSPGDVKDITTVGQAVDLVLSRL